MIDINDLIGKPFSTDPALAYGPDFYSCHGLLVEVYQRFGIKLPRVNISVTACCEISNKEINRQKAEDWQEISKPEMPCAVLIKSTSLDFANHIGAYIGDYRMLHVTINHNVNVDRISNWKNKIIGYYKYVGNSHKN